MQPLLPAALVVLLLGLARSPAAVRAQLPSGPAFATVISLDGLNLRSAPTTTSPIVALIPFASIVTLSAAPTADNWYPVAFGTLAGWSLGDYLTLGVVDAQTAQGAAPLSASSTPNLTVAITLPAARILVPPASPRTAAGTTGAGFRATASYYGVDDSATAGRIMACGAPFDPFDAHAAATNDFPCGTHLRVTGPDGRSVDVTVTDHGQYSSHWIDLTYAAFERIAEHRLGTIQVTLDTLP